MLNWLLSILVLKDIITEEEAVYLSEELATKMQPSRFREAHKIIEDILEEYKQYR